MVTDSYFKSVVKWIAENSGYSFLSRPDLTPVEYTDENGITRTMRYPGAKDQVRFIRSVKHYCYWRLQQEVNYTEVTFSNDHSNFRIHLKEYLYERE